MFSIADRKSLGLENASWCCPKVSHDWKKLFVPQLLTWLDARQPRSKNRKKFPNCLATAHMSRKRE
jgi:hypothetical protein